MKRIITYSLIGFVLLLVSCAREPEFPYRMEHNEITDEYRVLHWDKDDKEWWSVSSLALGDLIYEWNEVAGITRFVVRKAPQKEVCENFIKRRLKEESAVEL